jgi:hypothetical protein
MLHECSGAASPAQYERRTNKFAFFPAMAIFWFDADVSG